MDDPIHLIISLCALIISVMLHECAHAWSAFRMGDPTGKMMGRISLNPLRHIDPFYTIIMPIMLLVMSHGRFTLGAAKPVPINPLNFKNPGKGFMISSAAGPLTNFLLCIVSFLLLFALFQFLPAWINYRSYNAFFLVNMIFLNMALAVFNLIPIPPLDGSRILRYMLPSRLQTVLDSVERFGFIILILLIATVDLDFVIIPFYRLIAECAHLVGDDFLNFLASVILYHKL